MTDKDAARQKIAALVEKYRSTPKKQLEGYTEQQTREYFILPLFRALGWDTENPSEFSAEEQISRGFVDFGFYLNSVPAFYLETKRIAESIDKPEHMRQSTNYSYLKGVTWAVLSDFEGTMVFNAEWEETDPLKMRFLDLKWEHYANGQFDQLWLLSKPSIQLREIDREAERWGRKAKKEPVTDALFKQLTVWRRELFEQMRTYGTKIWSTDPRAVDNAVQKFLDRLIFLRTVEDRGVEGSHLKEVTRQAKGKDVFPNLLKLFREMDAVYNSNLFAESELDYMEVHDPDLLKGIVDGLYRAPGGFINYDFNAITADILGAVYEQYLGFKALDPEGRQDLRKQEKRKKQGIYYTPQFVVRYIVRQTLGKMLNPYEQPSPPAPSPSNGEGEFRMPTAEEVHNLRILDPACGSGSFLIEAFDVLDRWLAQHGTEEDKNFPRRRRLRILQENLYGVDLDDQAVEVTRLNLMLRAASERSKLPPLTHIQHGNSLIDDKDVAGEAAFKWEERFPEVMERGGFDVVIGNPPYVRMETFKDAKPYLRTNYQTHEERSDLYGYFIEKEHILLKPGGYFGMIVSNKFIRANYGAKLRRFITENAQLEIFLDLAGLPVFPDATVRTIVMTSKRIDRGTKAAVTYVPVMPVEKYQAVVKQHEYLDQFIAESAYELAATQFENDEWNFAPQHHNNLLRKLRNIGTPLIDFLRPLPIGMGVKSGLAEAFVINASTKDTILARNPEAAEIIKPLLNGRDIRRYHIQPDNKYLIYTYHGIDISRYPAVKAHLLPFQKRLENRATRQEWYELQQPQYAFAQYMNAPKIIFPDIATITRFALDTYGYYGSNTTYFLPVTNLFLLGLLNSKLGQFYFVQVCAALEGTGDAYLRFFGQYLEGFPVVQVDKVQHDRIVELVETMLRLKQEHAAAETALSDRRHDLAEQIERTDRAIDALVYELYGLSEDEIRIVEGR